MIVGRRTCPAAQLKWGNERKSRTLPIRNVTNPCSISPFYGFTAVPLNSGYNFCIITSTLA